jgi:hypothetical protein
LDFAVEVTVVFEHGAAPYTIVTVDVTGAENDGF